MTEKKNLIIDIAAIAAMVVALIILMIVFNRPVP